MSRPIQLAFLLLLTSCQSSTGYEQFFREAGQGLNSPHLNYRSAPVQIVHGGPTALENVRERHLRMFQAGYHAVGASSFTGAADSLDVDGARRQAEKVGATIVVIYSQYDETRRGVSTTYTPTTISGYDSRGRAVAGTVDVKTQVPYAVDRYAISANFYAPVKNLRAGIGFYSTDLSTEEQQAFNTNKGVVVRAVRRGSPSSDAEILAGDLLLSVNGQRIENAAQLRSMLEPLHESEITLVVRRHGAQIIKRFRMGPML